jgi:hypothetical protein
MKNIQMKNIQMKKNKKLIYFKNDHKHVAIINKILKNGKK